MSQKRREAIYRAIHEHITQFRIELIQQQGLSVYGNQKSVDTKLAQLTGPIFRDILMILEPQSKNKKAL